MIVFLLVLLNAGNLITEGKRLPQPDYGLQPNSRAAVLGCYKALKPTYQTARVQISTGPKNCRAGHQTKSLLWPMAVLDAQCLPSRCASDAKDGPSQPNASIVSLNILVQLQKGRTGTRSLQGMDVCLKIIINYKDFFDQSLDEIKLLKFVNKHDPADAHHILRLYDFFYYQVLIWR
jgi:hypothetical protein